MDATISREYRDLMRIFAIIPLLIVAACATPREQCESDAATPYRAALQERARLASDLAKGYTFQTRFEQRRRFGRCGLPHGGFYSCWETDLQPVTRRVPVNTGKLEARLAELDSALPDLRQTAGADTLQCRSLYPEDPSET
jgi:hypothetical protein